VADWSAIRTALSGWVAATTGLYCYWARRSQTFLPIEGYCELDITSPVTVGTDAVVGVSDPTADPGEEITKIQQGFRTFTFSVKVHTYQESVDLDALHYVSLIRDRIRLPVSSRVFRAADIGFASILSDVPVPTVEDMRTLSVRQIDLKFNAVSNESDTPMGRVKSLDDAEFQSPESTTLWTGDMPVGP